MFDLSGKVIVVIGGRGYLGRDFCQKSRLQGATVISADLPELSKAASKSEYQGEFNDIDQVDINVNDKKSIIKVIRFIFEKYNKIDTLIYSATSKPDDFYMPFIECSLEGWKSVINVELDGLFVAAQEVVKSLGQFLYLSAMSHADLLVGNTSSGIIEAASFHKPVVNIGNRQLGRLRGVNVIDCNIENLYHSIVLALSNDFIIKCQSQKNIYGDGKTSKYIVRELIKQPLSVVKKFIDIIK